MAASNTSSERSEGSKVCPNSDGGRFTAPGTVKHAIGVPKHTLSSQILHLAAAAGQTEQCTALVAASADPNRLDEVCVRGSTLCGSDLGLSISRLGAGDDDGAHACCGARARRYGGGAAEPRGRRKRVEAGGRHVGAVARSGAER